MFSTWSYEFKIGPTRLMENYTKGKHVEEPLERERVPIDCLPETFLWMKVKPGSKLRNLLGLATNSFKDERVVLWTGSGPAIIKAISCAEIMKRKFKNLHQITRVCFRKIDEVWQPITEGLDELIVEREVPTIHILLSKDPLDSNALGYQAPGDLNTFCGQEDVQPEKKKIPFRKSKQRAYEPRGKKLLANVEEDKMQSRIEPGVSERSYQPSYRKNQKRKRSSETEQKNQCTKEERQAEEKPGA